MATGVEMLGQMSEDIQLAGPVSGGNMVVKPNEAPVGAAAMLSKALRREANKGVAGIYELPQPQEPLPEFMRMAQQGVSQQESEQRNMYPNNFADDEGGILVLPRNLRTAPGVPQTSLAYITDEEKAILGLLKPGTPHKGPEDVPSYDSLDYVAAPSTPKPTGATQSSFDAVAQGGGTQQQQDFVQQFQQSEAGQNIQQQLQTEQQQQNNPFANTGQSVSDIVSDVKTGTSSGTDEGNLLSKLSAKERERNEKKYEEQRKAEKELREAEKSGDKKLITKAKTKLDKIIDSIKEGAKALFSDDDAGKYSDIEKDYRLKKLREKYPSLSDEQFKILFVDPGSSPTAFGKVMDFISDPNADQMTSGNYMAIMEDARKLGGVRGMSDTGGGIDEFWMDQYTYEHGPTIAEGLKNLPKAERDAILKDSASFKDYMSTMASDFKGKEDYQGSEAQRRADKADYYSGNMPQTSGGIQQLAGETTFSNADMEKMKPKQLAKAKAFNKKVFEARALANKERGDKQNNVGFNRPVVMEEEDVVEQVVEAGDPTMPYKGPRTGDKEVDVPLSRRFKTDPTKDVAQFTTTPRTQEDIYKYMTQGTTGEGITLEPFSEYQRRRRKALGLDPLELYG